MATPQEKTLHRAGISTDGWDRLEDVLDEYLTSPYPGQTLVSTGDGGVGTWAWPVPGASALYNLPPAAPDPDFDDEFNDGPDDPAARGWTVLRIDAATPVACIYDGPVDWTLSPRLAIPANHYRASVFQGRLYFQSGAGSRYFLGKPSPGAYRYSMSHCFTQLGTDSVAGLTLLDNLNFGYNTAGNSAVMNTSYATQAQFVGYDASVLTSYKVTAANEAMYQGLITSIDWTNTGNVATYVAMQATSVAIRAYLYSQVVAFTGTVQYAGMQLRVYDDLIQNAVAVDYIRRQPSGSWYPNT